VDIPFFFGGGGTWVLTQDIMFARQVLLLLEPLHQPLSGF
jgi:hypothetical protein